MHNSSARGLLQYTTNSLPLSNETWRIAYCLEIPGANGQGRTRDEARESLIEAIALILADRREDGLRGVPPEAIRETVYCGMQ
jgi:predicted RNase H-like HicB family nuclease